MTVLERVLLGLALWVWVAVAQSAAPVVNLTYATYRGAYNAGLNYTSFLGIRYADNPSPRWLAPKSPPVTTGITNATTYAPSCYQANIGQALINPFRTIAFQTGRTSLAKRASSPSEDCLFLNVFTPGVINNKQRLPVLLFIHGGGWVSGGAGSYPSMSDLVLESFGRVVTVQIQYRLGAFGWLAGQQVKNGGVLNAGLLDQEFAFKWVQKYISQFGGDPNQVTVWGESSGAGSILQHIVARRGQTNPPLFQGTITSSALLPAEFRYNDIFPEYVFSQIRNGSGCASSPSPLACLRNVSAATLQNANFGAVNSGFFRTSAFIPVIDDSIILERPSRTLEAGRTNGNYSYVVSNTREGYNLVPSNTTIFNFTKQLLPLLNTSQVNQVIATYQNGFSDDLTRMQAIVGEWTFICPSYYITNAYGSKGYRGIFDIPPASHAQDLGYYFPNIVTAQDLASYRADKFRSSFAQSFISMALFRNANTKVVSTTITPNWPTWSFNSPNEMWFGLFPNGTANVRINNTDAGLMRRCVFWNTISASTWQ